MGFIRRIGAVLSRLQLGGWNKRLAVAGGMRFAFPPYVGRGSNQRWHHVTTINTQSKATRHDQLGDEAEALIEASRVLTGAQAYFAHRALAVDRLQAGIEQPE